MTESKQKRNVRSDLTSPLHYVGARYVPSWYDLNDGNWEDNTPFQALVIVRWNDHYYISKKPVPNTVGEPQENPEYWKDMGESMEKVKADLKIYTDQKVDEAMDEANPVLEVSDTVTENSASGFEKHDLSETTRDGTKNNVGSAIIATKQVTGITVENDSLTVKTVDQTGKEETASHEVVTPATLQEVENEIDGKMGLIVPVIKMSPTTVYSGYRYTYEITLTPKTNNSNVIDNLVRVEPIIADFKYLISYTITEHIMDATNEKKYIVHITIDVLDEVPDNKLGGFVMFFFKTGEQELLQADTLVQVGEEQITSTLYTFHVCRAQDIAMPSMQTNIEAGKTFAIHFYPYNLAEGVPQTPPDIYNLTMSPPQTETNEAYPYYMENNRPVYLDVTPVLMRAESPFIYVVYFKANTNLNLTENTIHIDTENWYYFTCMAPASMENVKLYPFLNTTTPWTEI